MKKGPTTDRRALKLKMKTAGRLRPPRRGLASFRGDHRWRLGFRIFGGFLVLVLTGKEGWERRLGLAFRGIGRGRLVIVDQAQRLR